MANSGEDVNLRALVGHREFARVGDALETVQARFAAGRHDFMAVLEGRALAGLCSRREIGTLLGARYGFALYARAPVGDHLTPAPVIVRSDSPIHEVLHAVARRQDEHFYDDVLLTDPRGEFLGLIHVRDLVRLQHRLLDGNIAELGARNRQMEEDLRMAREVQVALLPRDFPDCRSESGRWLEFAQVFAPASGVSGDFFDVFPVSDHAAGLLMCDVMGHGVRSALVTSIVRTMVEEGRAQAADPAQFLTRLNASLTHLLQRTGDLIFVTACYGVVDAAARRLEFAHAGHPFPLLWRARAARCEALEIARDIGGPALGLMDDHVYAKAEVPLEVGDRLLLYTDGVTEAADAGGEEFGTAALGITFAAAAAHPLEQTLARVRERAAGHTGGAGFSDDVCLLACELRG
jgi:serine phosphatase RsbU (regulator of sigma subunit)